MSNGEAEEGKTSWFHRSSSPIMSQSDQVASQTHLQIADLQPQAGNSQTMEQTGTTIQREKTWKTVTEEEATAQSEPGHLRSAAVEEIEIDDFCHFYLYHLSLTLIDS
jgi:phage repressor protein C with HTH and peptisase S24 domain